MFLFFTTILLLGYLFILVFFSSRKNFLYTIALSYGVGSLLITMQLFIWLFIFRADFSYNLFMLMIIAENFLLLFMNKNNLEKIIINFKKINLFNKINLREILFIALICIQLFFVFSNVFARPVATFDSVTMWSLKSKLLFYNNNVEFNPDSKFYYLGGGGHRNYPWHVPLLQFWLHVNRGEYNDLSANLVFAIYFFSLLVSIFYFLRIYISRFKSLFFTFLLSSMPLIFYHAYNAYADLVLSYYIFIAFAYLFLWIDKKNREYLLFSSFLFGASFFVKDIAIISIIGLLLFMILYFLLKRIKIKEVVQYFGYMIITIMPWIFFKITHGLGISNVGAGINFHYDVINSIFRSLFASLSWNIWWSIVAIIFLINIRIIIKDKQILFGWFFLFFTLCGIFAIHLFTEAYKYALDYTAILRNILMITPVSVFLVGIMFQDNKLDN